jgi:nucleoside-diphosphate-sugar epimerase
VNAALISRDALPTTATEPISVTLEQYPFMWFAANNTRPIATRAARELGWTPKGRPFKDVLPETMDRLLDWSPPEPAAQ